MLNLLQRMVLSKHVKSDHVAHVRSKIDLFRSDLTTISIKKNAFNKS